MNRQQTQEMVKIAVPAVLESMVSVIIASIDTKMISVLGKPAISAVSFTTQPKMIFFAVFYALGTAASVFVAQAFGKKDKKEANGYFQLILFIAVILSIVLGAFAVFLAEPIMRLCNRQQDTLSMSVSFFRIIMMFLIFHALSTVLNSSLRGIGKTKVTLISNIAMGITDIIFNYLLIEGHLGFPRLEIVGDAIATVLGTAAALTVSIFFIVKESDFLSLRGIFNKSRLTESDIFNNVCSKAGDIVIESSIILSGLSSAQTAVYSVGMILMNYSFAFGDGIQSAVVSLTGRSMGAKKYDELKQYIRVGIVIGVICALGLSFLYISGARWYFGLFFKDTEAISEGVTTSMIIALITLLQIVRIICIGSMRGMGETKDPQRISTICVFAFNPLLSLLFTMVIPLGIWGIWLSSFITQFVWFLMGMLLCRRHIRRLGRNAAAS